VTVEAAPYIDHIGKDWRGGSWVRVGGGWSSVPNPLCWNVEEFHTYKSAMCHPAVNRAERDAKYST